MNKRIEVLICTKDRWSELALCLQSLSTQTYQDFDVMILDDASGNPILNCNFLQRIFQHLKIQGHRVIIFRNDMSVGVCFARNRLNTEYLKMSDNEYSCRIDDDVVLNPDYLSKLVGVIDSGFDIASGVTPLIGVPEWKRESKFVSPIINRHELDKEGNLIAMNDDCGYSYLDEKILPTHQFRSCALFKRAVVENIKYEENLSFVGFREEGFYSFRSLIKGYKIGVNTNAIAWHFAAPSGGTRSPEYQVNVTNDNNIFLDWSKRMFLKHGNFLEFANWRA